ncbi:MAG: hypothetical protein KUG76_04340 [Gammaproteobacteria bacterium]|nr:hypothetical protein [Gammaproteobacteria bacterium]
MATIIWRLAPRSGITPVVWPLSTACFHVLGRNDILITSRNMYGGSHQLIFDWYAKPSSMNIGFERIESFYAAESAPMTNIKTI